MDVVSDVLRVVRLGGAVFLNGEFTAPWCILSQLDGTLCTQYLPPSDHVVSYHLVTSGSCWARTVADPGTAIELQAGELLVVPQGEAHILGSSLELSPVSAAPLLARGLQNAPGQMITMSFGGEGAATRIICGFLACNETLSNPLLSSLPRLFKVDMRNDPRSAWLESSLEFAATEAAEWRAGSAIVLARLSELLFVEALRRCIDALPSDRIGWLAGGCARSVCGASAVIPPRSTCTSLDYR